MVKTSKAVQETNANSGMLQEHSWESESLSTSDGEAEEALGGDDASKAASSLADDKHSEGASESGGSGTGSGSGTHADSLFARRETMAVRRSKALVYAALVTAAVTVAIATYFLLRSAEKQDFESGFQVYSREVVHAIEGTSKSIFGQMRGLSTTATSVAMSSGQEWPFVTYSHFDLQASETIEYSNSELVLFAPIVTLQQNEAWNNYTSYNSGWIAQDLGDVGKDMEVLPIQTKIWNWDGSMEPQQEGLLENIRLPLWQYAPVHANTSLVNLDLISNPSLLKVIQAAYMHTDTAILSEVIDATFALPTTTVPLEEYSRPRSFVVQPVQADFVDDDHLVGFLLALIEWEPYFVDILPDGVNGVTVYMSDTCGSAFTYTINGREAVFDGYGDLHDPDYNSVMHAVPFGQEVGRDANGNAVYCEFTMTMYASGTFEASYRSSAPFLYATIIVVIFLFTMLVFMIYDLMVGRREEKVHNVAQRTTAIISSIFPKNVQERIMKEAEEQAEMEAREKKKGKTDNATSGGDKVGMSGGVYETKPIADFFPETTIVFADIVGFTAWSSMREPAQVFTLLETIYHSFDEIARKRRVFKVETVGDCYVAVAGLPQPRKDHAIVMARYARDCLTKFYSLTKKLELVLGPDTTDLALRVGMHSGPVTAGVLRGERSRFQLFGDTVNTASRLETTGECGKIHVSADTAKILNEAGKGHWLRDRKTKVTAKGKGMLQTYWLDIKDQGKSSGSSGTSENHNSGIGGDDDDVVIEQDKEDRDGLTSQKLSRLIDWVRDVMATYLKEIAAKRVASNVIPDPEVKMCTLEHDVGSRKSTTVLDEFTNVLSIPKSEPDGGKVKRLAQKIVLGQSIEEQLREYIHSVALLYNKNPFHNFERATHVTMSVVKFLSRIATSTSDEDTKLTDHSYGIMSSPLTQFGVVFAALIHDVDHPGVENEQLMKEGSPLCEKYNFKHVSEQHSIDMAWKLLMEPRFADLRRAIYVNEAEFDQFRQTVINMMLATDNSDEAQFALRAQRWEQAFVTDIKKDNLDQDEMNHRATLVLEHLLQASDISHTMQHWHIYCKWNARLLQEKYKAWLQGREPENPTVDWYKGEMGFFDFYVIPLARKLKDSGVFGCTSDEYLNYAERNREEWELKGEGYLEDVLQEVDNWKAEIGMISPSKDTLQRIEL